MTDQVRVWSRAPRFVAPSPRELGNRTALIRFGTAFLVAVLVGACSVTGSAAPGSHTATQVESPVVGTWQTTVTKDDLRAGGISDPGLLNENAGRFTRTFLADGTWKSAQESLDGSSIHNPVWRGSYAVMGDEIRAQVDFPTEYQGDTERYRWVVNGNELRLTVLEPTDDLLLRLGTESHPWTRTTP